MVGGMEAAANAKAIIKLELNKGSGGVWEDGTFQWCWAFQEPTAVKKSQAIYVLAQTITPICADENPFISIRIN